MNKLEKNSILLVDDEPVNIQLLSRILGADYKLYAAKDGNTALQMAKEHIPDLILLDIVMPEVSGYHVLEQIKATEEIRDIPVVFITGLDSADDEEKGLSLDAADYINKPFKDNVVKLRVRNQIKIINAMRTIEKLNNTDQLTGIPNRHAFDLALVVNWKRAIRDVKPISLIMIDFDLFKRYNDTYGHLQGDSTLRTISLALTNKLEKLSGIVARWGGDEFAILLPQANESDVQGLAEELRQTIENTMLDFEGEIHNITASLGTSTITPSSETDMGVLLINADEALYCAKKEGRNRISVFEN